MNKARIRRAYLWFFVLSTKYLSSFSLSTAHGISKLKKWPSCETKFLGSPSRKQTLLCSVEYNKDDDAAAFVEHFEEDAIENSVMASPLSQLPSEEEEALYRGVFSRKKRWLEEATEEMLDLEALPLGSLSEDDVESITGLMAAWVRRRSLDAALIVEKLLKRVVDDMRVQNPDVHVTTRMYAIVSIRGFLVSREKLCRGHESLNL